MTEELAATVGYGADTVMNTMEETYKSVQQLLLCLASNIQVHESLELGSIRVEAKSHYFILRGRYMRKLEGQVSLWKA